MEIGNGLVSISAINYRKIILTIIILYCASINLLALPRRTREDSTWEEKDVISPIPSQQTHAGPLIFSTFVSNDLQQAEAISELESRIRLDSLRAQQKTRLRGEVYRDFITAQLQELRLPSELLTIVYIESSFDIRAQSKTGARGLWQFADNSMEPWLKSSMTSPKWDERFDFWKSTEAALAKLQENYARTGSWILSIAAYNGGLGRLGRAVTRSESTNFWELERGTRGDQISAQTSRYVSKFIAASIISLYPGRFGISLNWDEAYIWTRLPYAGSLREFAEKTSVPLQTIYAGNAEYMDGVIPAGGHYVKFPISYKSSVMESIKQAHNINTMPEHFHFVRLGDTLWNISTRYNLSIEQLRDMNGMTEDEILKSGTHLIVKPISLGGESSDNIHIP